MEVPTFSVFSPRRRAAFAARRLAAEFGLDIDAIAGMGLYGRVLSDDVRRAADTRSAPAPAVPAVPAVSAVESTSIPHTNMRRTIARRMQESYIGAPTFFLTVAFDCDGLVAFRGQLKAAGVKVSYNDILMKATARALRDVPAINASWGPDEIVQHGEVNIGMAVALDGGLIVPVVRDVDQKGLSQIASETRELAGRARELRLKPEEYQGSTFTISNLGMMGIEHFTAIINQPNSAILAVGGLQQEPVVRDGVLTVGWRMRVTMTCDHRVIDGALGSTFLQVVRKYIENPVLLAT
jgi:pyruvate dehydrogenase E2 component (dihydrolipoamide acetyltransferase)